jgi:TolA-binding protein
MRVRVDNLAYLAGCLVIGIAHLTLPSTGFGGTTPYSAFSSESAMGDTSAKRIELTAQVLYDQARRGVKKKEYWKSTLDLIVIMEYYPEFTKIEDAIFLLGNCLFDMELFHASDRVFRYLLENFPKTALFPEAALGLQKTNYSQRQYQQSLKFYTALESHYPQHDGIHESRYYASQAHYHLKNYTLVPNITQLINKGNSHYPFALYTEALVHLKKKNMREALDLLFQIRDQSSKSKQHTDLIDAARLTLGYIYFELSNYNKAVEQLVEIDPSFYDYPEVLLTLGWCAYKLEDYRAAIDALNSLVKDYPNDHLLDEAHFVLGQCYMKLGYHNFAIKEFDIITNNESRAKTFEEYGDEAILTIARQEKQVEKLKTELLLLETKLLQSLTVFGSNGAPDFIAKQRDKMRVIQENLIQEIMGERQVFEGVSTQLVDLRRWLKKAEVQKKWLAYAEYGKTRALYLKGVANQ